MDIHRSPGKRVLKAIAEGHHTAKAIAEAANTTVATAHDYARRAILSGHVTRSSHTVQDKDSGRSWKATAYTMPQPAKRRMALNGILPLPG
jgi:hypothetical protein